MLTRGNSYFSNIEADFLKFVIFESSSNHFGDSAERVLNHLPFPLLLFSPSRARAWGEIWGKIWNRKLEPKNDEKRKTELIQYPKYLKALQAEQQKPWHKAEALAAGQRSFLVRVGSWISFFGCRSNLSVYERFRGRELICASNLDKFNICNAYVKDPNLPRKKRSSFSAGQIPRINLFANFQRIARNFGSLRLYEISINFDEFSSKLAQKIRIW